MSDASDHGMDVLLSRSRSSNSNVLSRRRSSNNAANTVDGNDDDAIPGVDDEDADNDDGAIQGVDDEDDDDDDDAIQGMDDEDDDDDDGAIPGVCVMRSVRRPSRSHVMFTQMTDAREKRAVVMMAHRDLHEDERVIVFASIPNNVDDNDKHPIDDEESQHDDEPNDDGTIEETNNVPCTSASAYFENNDDVVVFECAPSLSVPVSFDDKDDDDDANGNVMNADDTDDDANDNVMNVDAENVVGVKAELMHPQY
jgi:hypothetical protein